MGEINFELLDTVHKFIQTHPEAHYQGRYAEGKLVSSPDQYDETTCGSTGCIAGWAAVFDGWKQLSMNDEMVSKNDKTVVMHAAGAESLGLSIAQAENLFAGGNTREAIDDMIDKLHDDPTASLNDEREYDVEYRRDR